LGKRAKDFEEKMEIFFDDFYHNGTTTAKHSHLRIASYLILIP
jgi:hypothetical protein